MSMESVEFVQKAKDPDSILRRSGIRPPSREKYTIINTAHLDSMTLPKHPDFIKLKAELDEFNNQVRKALAENKVIYSYTWKHFLFNGLRSMLVEIANTEEKILMESFLAKAKKWFNDKMEKKRKAGDLEKSTNTSYTQSTRAVSDNSRVLSTATKKNNEQENSLNISAIKHEGDSIDQKSFFVEGMSEIMPSQYRDSVLRDYEEGNRSMHGSVDPPYERILNYERKVPKGILKPLSLNKKAKKADQTINFESNKPVSILKDEDLDENSASEKGSDADDDKDDKDDKEDKDDGEEGKEDVEAPEGAEGQENIVVEGDVKIEPKVFKPGIVTPAHRMYLNDRITRKLLETKDLHLPMETRSMHSHYLASGAVQELSLERRWRESMHKKVIEKREAEENRAYMKQWSYAKARLEEETVRRQDSFNLGSGFGKRAFSIRARSAVRGSSAKQESNIKDNEASFSQSRDRSRLNQSNIEEDSEKIVVYQETKDKQAPKPKIVNIAELRNRNSSLDRTDLNKSIESDMSKIRIQNIKRFHENSLFNSRGVASDIGEDGAYSVNRPLSLSVYDNQNRKNYTPFSAVHEKVNSHAYFEKQISVVSDIKAKLAKFRMKISMKSLENTILPARNLDESQDANKSVLLPEPGRGLFFNPFIKTREKRKKKGKKKT